MNTTCSGNFSQQNCSAKDCPRVGNKCLHLDTLRGGNMKHKPWSKTHINMMCSWCEPPTLEEQSEMKFPKFAEMHNDQQPTCSLKLPRPMQTTLKRKIRIQLVRGMNPITTNMNTMQSSQETHTFNHQKTHRCGNTTLQTPKVVSE